MNQKIYLIIVFFFLSFAAKSQLQCIERINFALGLDGTFQASPTMFLASSPDPTSTYSLSKSLFTCADIGALQTVALYELKGGIIVDTCFTIVNVEDKFISPLCPLSCIGNLNVTLGPDGFATLEPTMLLSSIPNPNSTYSLSKSVFTCDDIGIGLMWNVVVSELRGGISYNTCSTNVNVEDKNNPPVCSSTGLSCKGALNIALGSNGTAIVSPTTFLASTPNPNATYSLSKSVFTCADIGALQTVFLYESIGGISFDTCNIIVTVEDKFSPPVCQPVKFCIDRVNFALGLDGTFQASPTMFLASSPDPTSTYSLSKSLFTCADIGALQTVSLYEKKGGIIVDTCFTIVNVEDKFFPPVCPSTNLSCVGNLNISLGPDGTATLNPTDFLSSAPNPTSTYSLSKSVFTCDDIGAPQTVFLYESIGGISYDTCNIIVNVEDKFFPPVCSSTRLSCIGTLNIALGQDGTATVSRPTTFLASTPNPTSTYSLSKSVFTCADIGAPFTVAVYELRGGISYDTCFTIVNVEDKLIPRVCLACVGTLNIALGSDGTAIISPTTFLASAPSSTSTYSLSKSVFTCKDIGALQTVVLYEIKGGVIVDSCFSMVNVEDKFSTPICTPPLLVCSASLNLSLDSNGRATVKPSDLLISPLKSSYQYTVTPSTFNCSNKGNNTVVLTATTTAGVSNQCTTNVIVNDNRPGVPPCVSLSFANIRFVPNNIWLSPVPPLTSVPFEAILSSEAISKISKADLVFAISNDRIFDSNDIIVSQSPINIKKKESQVTISGLIQVPASIQSGKYFLLADVFSNSKKLNIGLNMYVLPIEIGFDQQIIRPSTSNINVKQSIYPNPFTNKLTINLESEPISTIEIFNFTGQLIKRINYGNPNSLHVEIDLSELSNGNYHINVRDKEGNIFNKTIIKH